jgi:hypothetical protein
VVDVSNGLSEKQRHKRHGKRESEPFPLTKRASKSNGKLRQTQIIKETKTMLKSKKFLAVTLAVVLVLSVSISALASAPSGWFGFQGGYTSASVSNNGTIDNGAPPTAAPTATSVPLSYTGTAWTGVDTTSIINSGVAYTLYNGGDDGALLSAVTVSTATPLAWSPLTIDSSAVNGFQLSTPYLDIASNTLYTLTTSGSGASSVWLLSSVNLATQAVTPLVKGTGEANTPITAHNDKNGTADYLFFGTFTGASDNNYYQYTITPSVPGVLTAFAAKDDFYWTGAAILTLDATDYAVFGGDNGYIYVNPVGTGFATPANSIKIVDAIYTPGAIRSTVVAWGGNVYFTSQAQKNGLLWYMPQSGLLTLSTVTTDAVLAGASSTSTPVISGNNILYVGSYSGFSSGYVEAFDPTSLNPVAQIYPVGTATGDPVQASPIVFSVTAGSPAQRIDYVYFTTNSSSGAGYCYSLTNLNAPVIASVWSVAGTGGNPYAVQGFAADNGYLVYGNDGNVLSIFHS